MSSSFNRWGPITLFVLALVMWLSFVVHARQQQTVEQGVYTSDQARRGQAVYKDQCASCHGEALAGGLGPPLIGGDFISLWNEGPLSELASKIQNTMPQNAAGKLTPQQTADTMAYMLQAAGFPAGQAELSASVDVLKQISWPAGTTTSPTPLAVASATPSFPPAGNLTQVMRGILFPSSNIIFTAQTQDPSVPKVIPEGADREGGFSWVIWSGGIYTGWELIDYAAIALAESAPLMLSPGRRCENGRPVPVNDPDWIKFTQELAEAGKAAYKASQTRNQETISDASNLVNDACLNCHLVYRDHPERVMRVEDPSNKAARCAK
jgi:mono/diheme cytochrome c family protein